VIHQFKRREWNHLELALTSDHSLDKEALQSISQNHTKRRRQSTNIHLKRASGERNMDNRFHTQLLKAGSGRTRLETSRVRIMLCWKQRGISHESLLAVQTLNSATVVSRFKPCLSYQGVPWSAACLAPFSVASLYCVDHSNGERGETRWQFHLSLHMKRNICRKASINAAAAFLQDLCFDKPVQRSSIKLFIYLLRTSAAQWRKYNTHTKILKNTKIRCTRWATISGPPKFFVYNFHCKQPNFTKFQQEAYQDMLHHMQHKFHTFESQFWLKQCVTSSVLSRIRAQYG